MIVRLPSSILVTKLFRMRTKRAVMHRSTSVTTKKKKIIAKKA